MRGGQANADFQGRVGAWQRKLGAVDTVLSSWADVQRKWQGLQSIFIGSADIREQLPEDSKRFGVLNENFEVGLGFGGGSHLLHRLQGQLQGLLPAAV